MIHRNKKSYICLFFILLVGACDKPATRIEKEKAEYSFTFDIESHDVARTANTYTRAVTEENKPEGDKRATEYTSSNKAIATVDNAGMVTFKTPGTVTITATRAAGSGYAEAKAGYVLHITMKPANKQALADEITRAINAHGNEVNLNYIDTSGITDMSTLFFDESGEEVIAEFNGDISGWDVSEVANMSGMFWGANVFNKDISKWKVANVTNMSDMFWNATAFDQDISGWDVGKVTNMKNMFRNATSFKQNLNAWKEKINKAIRANDWLNALSMFAGSRVANNLPSWCKEESNCRKQAIKEE